MMVRVMKIQIQCVLFFSCLLGFCWLGVAGAEDDDFPGSSTLIPGEANDEMERMMNDDMPNISDDDLRPPVDDSEDTPVVDIDGEIHDIQGDDQDVDNDPIGEDMPVFDPEDVDRPHEELPGSDFDTEELLKEPQEDEFVDDDQLEYYSDPLVDHIPENEEELSGHIDNELHEQVE